MEIQYTYKIGEQYVNKDGKKFTITGDFHRRSKITKSGKKNQRFLNVKFESGYETVCQAIKSAMQAIEDFGSPTVYGVGITFGKQENKRARSVWCAMLARCYSQKSKGYKYYGAKGVRVCKRWLNLQNFVADLPNLPNYSLWESQPEKYSLDKDYLIKGNKTYSPEACSFQSNEVQGQYAGRKRSASGIRGITWDKRTQSWTVTVSDTVVAKNLNHINDAISELIEHLSSLPNHPQSRFGIFYDGLQ